MMDLSLWFNKTDVPYNSVAQKQTNNFFFWWAPQTEAVSSLWVQGILNFLTAGDR